MKKPVREKIRPTDALSQKKKEFIIARTRVHSNLQIRMRFDERRVRIEANARSTATTNARRDGDPRTRRV